MFGRDAAWAAVVAGAMCKWAIKFARQTRYFSATLTISVCCCFAVWMMYRRGWWRDFVLGGICFVLLFHTHILTFFILCGSCCVLVPGMIRKPRFVGKAAMFTAITGAGIVPWMILTGFAKTASQLPAARSLFHFFWEPLGYPLSNWQMSVMFLCTVAGLTIASLPVARRRWPRLVEVLGDRRMAFWFLASWGAVGFIAFTMLIPAASYFRQRLTLTVFGPGLLLGAVACAVVARMINRKHSSLIATGLFLAILIPLRQMRPLGIANYPTPYPATLDVIDLLRGMDLKPGTRLYASPNHHLLLQFYTGLPVRDIAATRKSFGFIPRRHRLSGGRPALRALPWTDVKTVLADSGQSVTDDEAAAIANDVSTLASRRELQKVVATVEPPPRAPLPYDAALLQLQRSGPKR